MSERLVGSPAFKAGGTGDPRPASSILVHLRQPLETLSWARSPPIDLTKMRYRFQPLDQSPRDRWLDSFESLDRVGDLVAAVMMPVYLSLVALIAWYDGFSLVSTLVAGAVALNCRPASRGLRALRASRVGG